MATIEPRSEKHNKSGVGRDNIFARKLKSMNYESPSVRYQGGLDDVFHRLLPCFPLAPSNGDPRIAKLTDFIDSRDGRVGLDLTHTCRELKLDISGAYAGRLFKLATGLGVREYAKKKRLSAAAKLLSTTNLPVKAIAVEFGYSSPPDFTRRFKKQFHLSPSNFRKQALLEPSPSSLRLSRVKRVGQAPNSTGRDHMR